MDFFACPRYKLPRCEGSDLPVPEQDASCERLQHARVRHHGNAALWPLQDVLPQLLYPPVKNLCMPRDPASTFLVMKVLRPLCGKALRKAQNGSVSRHMMSGRLLFVPPAQLVCPCLCLLYRLDKGGLPLLC